MEKIRKVLIVDDEEKARLYLANILAELYPLLEIQLASTPSEALFLIKKQQFDLAVLDVEMQGMTGIEMVIELQKHKSDLPVIFVSGYKKAELIQKALRLNAVDYIDKPVDPFELDRAIKKALFIKDETSKESNYSTEERKKFCLLTDIDERFLESDEVFYFQSSKRYSIVHFVDGNQRIVRNNLIYLKNVLPSNAFLHVSRQYIINVMYLKNVSKSNKNITLRCGDKEIKLGKIFPNVLSELIKSHSLKSLKSMS